MLLSVLCFACNNEMRNVKAAANDYLMAVSLYDVDGAERYCTEETKETTLDMARFLLQYVDSSYLERDKPVEIDIISIKSTSDTTATVHYRKTTPVKDFTDTLEMRKRDGMWLAHAPMVKNNAVTQ